MIIWEHLDYVGITASPSCSGGPCSDNQPLPSQTEQRYYLNMTSQSPVPDAQPPSERELIDIAMSTLRQRLPDDWLLDSAPDKGARSRSFDALYVLTAPDGTKASIGVDVRRLVEPRDVATLRNKFAHGLAGDTVDIPMIAARYLSRSVQDKLAAAGLSFVDATGNTLVRSRRPALHISDRGADQDPWRGPGRPRGTLKGEPAAKVVRALIDLPGSWSVRDLVEVSRASTGSVYRVLEYLESEGLATRDVDGRWLTDGWQPMLRRWSVDYQFSSTNRVSRWIAVRGIDAFVDSLRRNDVGNYVLTGSVAAGTWAPYAPARLASVYVDDAATAAQQWDLRPTDSGANVLLAEPRYAVVRERSLVALEGLRIAAPAQVAADLMSGPGRAPSEAEALMAWMERNEQSWR